MTDLTLLSQQQTAERQAEISRMRIIATALLGVMFGIYVIASAYAPQWPWLAYPKAFTEAAMVGACADWFAIVALFRHPFGIPIPHTAIVPRHKKQVAESFGEFISQNFLAPTIITARLQTVDAAGWIARWLNDPENTKKVAARLPGLLPLALNLLKEEQLRRFSRDMIHQGIDSIAAGPLTARVVSVLIEHDQHNAAFDLMIDSAWKFVKDHQNSIRNRVSQNSAKWLPNWVDNKVTDAFLTELMDALTAARKPDHPWRTEFRGWIAKLAFRLAHDQQMIDQCERIKSDVLHNSVVDGYLDWLGEEVEYKVQTELASPDGILSHGLEHALTVLGNWLESDDRIRQMINHWAQQLVLSTIVPNREEIGHFVTEVVERWDTKTLVDKLELRVGKDLQYIRVNGTLVGGLVGLIIYTVSKMLGS